MGDKKPSAMTLTTPAASDLLFFERPADTTARYSTVTALAKAGRDDGWIYANDYASLQLAINALSLGKKLYIEPGTYEITDTLSCKSKDRIEIWGEHVIIKPAAGSNFTNKSVMNLSGTTNSKIYGLHLLSDLTSNKPAACLIYGRNSGGGGGDIYFDRCWIGGDCTVASAIMAQADTSGIDHSRIYSTGTAPPLLLTTHNDSGLLDYASSTLTQFSVNNSYIYSYTASTIKLIVFQGFIQRVKFDGCFFSLPDTTTVLSIEDSASATIYNQCHQIGFVNCTVENGASGARWINVTNSYSLTSLYMLGCSWSADVTALIEINSQRADEGLKSAYIIQVAQGHTENRLIKMISGKLQFSHIQCGTDQIEVGVGCTAENNFIETITGLNPFGTSPAGTLTYNIITDYQGRFSHRRSGYESYTVPDGETYPSANASIMIFSHSIATAITNIVGHISGQIVYCIFTNGNTTVSHSVEPNTGIYLKDNIDWNAPAGSTLTLINKDTNIWYEVSRMVRT